MIGCGIISRTFASFTTPVVVLGTPEKKSLQYDVDGEGTIESSVTEYLPCLSGIRVERIYKRAGQEVKKGDNILKYRLEEIEEQMLVLEKELKQQQLAIQQEEINGEENPSAQAANRLNVQSQKETINDLNKQLKQLKQEEQLLIDKNTKQLLKEKQEEKKTASYALETEKLNQEETMIGYEKQIEDAQDEIKSQEEWEKKLKEAIAGYLASENQMTKRQEYLEKLYAMSYGGEKEWDSHKKEIESANIVSVQAQTALQAAQKAYQNAIIQGETNLSSYEAAVTSAQNEVQQALGQLIRLQEKENEIANQLKKYEEAAKKGSSERSILYEQLKETIYGEETLATKEKEYENALKTKKRLQDELERTKEKGDLAIEEKQHTVDEITAVIEQLEEGTYSFDDAKKEIEDKKQSLEEEKEAAIKQYKQLQMEQTQSQYENQKTKQSETLKIESMKLDYEAKQRELQVYQDIKKTDGYVSAPKNGTITAITVSEGKKASEDDTICIGTKGFTAVIFVDAAQADYLSIGEMAELSRKGETEKIKAEIHSIQYQRTAQTEGTESGLNGSDEQVEVRFQLPKGTYIQGQSISMHYTKKTDDFSCCIPLSALREDGKGNYVLILQERQTVLGAEQEAVRLGVTVLDKDDKNAALEPSLDSSTSFILSSTKMVEEGARVRVEK